VRGFPNRPIISTTQQLPTIIIIVSVKLQGFLFVDVVLCLKGSYDDDVQNHLVIPDFVSIGWI